MPVPVQSNSGSGTQSVPAGFTTTPGSISLAFASNNTAGNAIVVACGVSQQNTFGTNTFSASDTRGNSYTKIAETDSGNNTGGALSLLFAPNILSGANTVTVNFQTGSTSLSTTLDILIAIAEYSLSSPSLQSQATQNQNPGGTISITITDSNVTSVTFGTTTPQIGSFVFADLLSGRVNYLFACGIGGSPITPTITPSGYASLTQRQNPNLSGNYLYLWDSGPGASTRIQPQVCVVT